MKIESLESVGAFSAVGDIYRVLLDSAATGGAFSLIHAVVPPGGGPPFHTHTREEELLYVLEGEVTFFSDAGERVVGPGGAAFFERGERHRFENRSDATAQMLIQTTPAGFEEMLREAGTPLAPGQTEPHPVGESDIARLVAACERAGITIHM